MLGKRPQVLAPGLDAFEIGFDGCAEFAGNEIARLFGLLFAVAHEPIKPTLAFAPGITVGDHALDELAERRGLVDPFLQRVVRRQQRLHAGNHVGPEINTGEVHQAENAGLGNSHRPADDGVGLLDREPRLRRRFRRHQTPIDADPVGDEARCVLARHDFLAEHLVAEPGQRVDCIAAGVGAGDDFQKPHVARRIKEMSNREIGHERIRQPLDQARERYG